MSDRFAVRPSSIVRPYWNDYLTSDSPYGRSNFSNLIKKAFPH